MAELIKPGSQLPLTGSAGGASSASGSPQTSRRNASTEALETKGSPRQHQIQLSSTQSVSSSPNSSSTEVVRQASAATSLAHVGEALRARASVHIPADILSSSPSNHSSDIISERNGSEKQLPTSRAASITELLHDYRACSWFFAKMSEPSAERLLLEKGDTGEFIVRQEVIDSDRIVLSFNDGLGVQHFPISFDHHYHRFHLTMDPVLQFSSLTHLVNFYQNNTIANTHFQLQRPFGQEAIARAGLLPVSSGSLNETTRPRLFTNTDLPKVNGTNPFL